MLKRSFRCALALTLISLLSACSTPTPPPAAPPVDDPNKIYPDRLLEEMTFPYDKFGWVETVLAFRLQSGGGLEAAATFVDRLLGKARVMRRVRVHKHWVVVGLGGVNRSRLQRLVRLLDDEQVLGVFRVDMTADYAKKLEQWAAGSGASYRKDPGGGAFLWASTLPVLEKALVRLAEEVGLPQGRRLAVADHAEGTVYGFRTHLLVDPPWVTITDLQSAVTDIDTRENIEQEIRRQPMVRLTFRKAAARRLTELTSRAKGRQVAFLIGGRIRAISAMSGPILDGKIALPMRKELTYGQREEEAHKVVRKLTPLAGMPRLHLDGIYGSQPE